MILTKGIIEEVVSPYKAKVRLPVYHGIKADNYSVKTKDLPEATLCAMPNCDYALNAGDIVYCSIEDNDFSKPVILGFLYKQDKAQTAVDMSVNSLGVVTNTSLPEDTAIGKVGSESIQNLLGIDSNIQRTLSNMNSDLSGRISNTDKSVSNIWSSINAIRGDYVDKSTDQIINGQKDFEITPRVKVAHETHNLPERYQEVEYIQSNGSGSTTNTGPYIDTNFIPSSNTRVEAKFKLLETTTSFRWLFGVRDQNAAGAGYSFGSQTNGLICSDFNGRVTGVSTFTEGTIYNIIKNGRVCQVNSTVLTNTATTFSLSYPLGLFCLNNVGSFATRDIKAQCYYFKIYDYENSEFKILRDFVPCCDTQNNNKPGLYDLVNGEFYSCPVSGSEFILGPAIYPGDTYDAILTDADFNSFLLQIPGYNGAASQTLKHSINGSIQWVND